MMTSFLTKIFGTKHDRQMKALQPLINEINSYESKLSVLSDAELKAKTPELKQRLANGETTDDILPEAFAVCREASKRVLGMRHYDVQLIGGITLHRGQIAEMRTGEGKTLVGTLPVYLNALTGRGVHVVTVNDYLARRDAEWMGRLYGWLGLTTGIIVHDLSDTQRKANYNCDITYATNNELGFDYLRDNMKFDLKDYVQRELHFAIVDECDSILVDEARTPLIISGPAETSTDKYILVDKIIPKLQKGLHFTIEEKSKTAALTEEGNTKVEELLGVDNIFDPQNIDLLHHVYQGLKAHFLFQLDVDYMIKDDEIVIVDEFTGRLMAGRRWSDGLHQAIEAKEGVKVKNENQTLATITFQNYFRMYSKLAGMTGTADTEAVEFKQIYNLEVTVIPTNRPIQRMDEDDVVYKTINAKFKAIAKDVKERHANGQPCLVGTVSIEKSELMSKYLKSEGVPHKVLNAKHHAMEADIVAQAGRKNAVTIATNMAGRGTDIVLGGNAEMMAKQFGEEGSPEFLEAYAKFKKQCEAEKVDVLAAGGLYIVGTERHESRRIDNQLRGRAGRQGDPGASRFYLSLEDNLMRIFNGERIQKIMDTLNVPEDEPITAGMVSRAIEGAQRKVEGHNFDIRKHLLDYDNVMNQQRQVIYKLRRKILEGQDVERTTLDMLGDVTSHILDTHLPEESKGNQAWNFEGLANDMQQSFGIKVEPADLRKMDPEKVVQSISEAIKTVFDRQKAMIGQYFEQIQKMILLQSIDQRWKEHLLIVDRLKEGINLRGYAQKDPLIEYKKEAFKAFEDLNLSIRNDTVEKLLRVQLVASEEQMAAMENMLHESAPEDLTYQAPAEEVDAFAGFAPELGNDSAASEEPKKRYSMTAGPNRPSDDDSKLNREQRRKLKKK